MREFSKNISLVEVRLHCLDMAVNSARLLGRAEAVESVANTYFAWVTQVPQRPEQPRQSNDDAGAVGTEPQQQQSQPPQPGAGGNATPPSLRGAGNTPAKD